MQCSKAKALGRSCHGGNVELSLRRTRMTNMIIKAIKTTGLSIALAATFLVAAGSSIAFAQDGRGRDRDRDGWQDNRRDRDDRRDNDRDGWKDDGRDHDGWQDNHRDRDDWQDSRWVRFEARRGYRDGLLRGREDALEHRRFNLFGHPRFRFGDSDYREGFRSGY